MCYYKYSKGAADRRLPLDLINYKNSRSFSEDGAVIFLRDFGQMRNLLRSLELLLWALSLKQR